LAYERLQNLGKDKFTKICNELARGTPAILLARLIHEWGDAHDVGESTLAKQLLRLHTAITNAAFGGDLAQVARDKASVRIKLFHGSTLDCLDELVTLASIQQARINAMWEKEREGGTRVAGLNKVINDYRNLLMDIQKMRFDLGLDEYKRGIPTVTASLTGPTRPYGTTTEQQVFEAISQVEAIFARRGLPKMPD
jgi:hypothetical protein